MAMGKMNSDLSTKFQNNLRGNPSRLYCEKGNEKKEKEKNPHED